MKADLAVQGGTLATPDGTFEADIYVQEGKILGFGKVYGVRAKRLPPCFAAPSSQRMASPLGNRDTASSSHGLERNVNDNA